MKVQIEEKTNGFEIFTNVITDVAKNRCSWCIFNAHKKDCCRDCRNANNFIFKTEKVFDKYEELVKFFKEKNMESK